MRNCGSCTLCCTLTRVPELDKAEGTKCRYCEQGCSIYENRPESCRKFKCVWLADGLPLGLRPDRCNVMFEHLDGSASYVGMVEKGKRGWKREAEDYANSVLAEGFSVIMNVGVGEQRYIKTVKGITEKEVLDDLYDAYKRLMEG